MCSFFPSNFNSSRKLFHENMARSCPAPSHIVGACVDVPSTRELVFFVPCQWRNGTLKLLNRICEVTLRIAFSSLQSPPYSHFDILVRHSKPKNLAELLHPSQIMHRIGFHVLATLYFANSLYWVNLLCTLVPTPIQHRFDHIPKTIDYP